MSLIYNEDQQQLLDSARDYLAARSPVSAQRALRDQGVAQGFDSGVWQGMVELGWSAVAFAEEQGGLDFGFAGYAPIFEQIGQHLSAAPLLSSVVLCGSLIEQLASAEQQQALLPQLISGAQRYALALDEHDRHQPDKCTLQAVAEGDGYRLDGSKCWVADGVEADGWLVVARLPDGLRGVFVVPAGTAGVSVAPRRMIDARNMAALSLQQVELPAEALLNSGDTEAALERALDRGRACLAAELLGICDRLLDTTVEYLKTRVQFDAPIGSFQALQHRAARLYVQQQLARNAVMAAFEALDREQGDIAERRRLVALAKWKANQAAQLISNEAVQMHGGIGVTDELDIGLYLKRVRVAQAQLGRSDLMAARYAAQRLAR
ncbi:acyl-CoA dehydrogenase family protein [Halopseudomonas maritima]|uniref:acyl-CoA dehydrogenase family protein n=1 Tax=Halopseudomonas maritima TaxID=2918528 RepID=UPI001EECE76C|nr:acyl-CoA dehydrogenase family protein [Halopseudomonas maritima]UJJ31575.1 acyl-CoA dehydrogenase family protein [Halopseudomonas maritima]